MPTKMPSKIRYSYYLPVLDLQAGEADLASQAQAIYTRLGLDRKYCHRYDGVSIFSKPDGQLMVRVSLQSFFNDRVDVKTFDMPYVETQSCVCCFCGGDVSLREPNLDTDYRSIRINGLPYHMAIPKHIHVQKCGSCGEVFCGETEARRIAEARKGDMVW